VEILLASFARSPPWAEPCPLVKLSVLRRYILALGLNKHYKTINMKDDKKESEISYEEEKDEGLTGDIKKKLEKLKEDLRQCQKEKQDNLAGWQRSQADFVNYRRRQEEQMGEWSKMFGEGLLRDILPVLDTLDASISNSQDGGDGFKMIRDQLMKILNQHGLAEMKTIGEKFDHNFHEAVETLELEEEGGQVVEEVQKGYLLNGKVLRPAKVKVSK